jgi:hypothetical protein
VNPASVSPRATNAEIPGSSSITRTRMHQRSIASTPHDVHRRATLHPRPNERQSSYLIFFRMHIVRAFTAGRSRGRATNARHLLPMHALFAAVAGHRARSVGRVRAGPEHKARHVCGPGEWCRLAEPAPRAGPGHPANGFRSSHGRSPLSRSRRSTTMPAESPQQDSLRRAASAAASSSAP